MIRILALIASICCAWPQDRTNRVVSPEIAADQRVTFRVQAPKASEAALVGDWMAPGKPEAMTRDTNGVWSITVGPMKSGLYIYTFTVDGMTIADPVNPQIKLRARTSASLLEVPGKTPELWEARDVPHGTVEILPHASKTLGGETRQVWIYKPPGYDKNRTRRYPILYLLHGSNDTGAGWTTVGRAHFIMDNLLADKRAREMIIVMPFGHAIPFDAPREEQSRNTALFGDYLLKDLMPMVESQYRIAKGRENRAIVGLSMGGGQAAVIGLSNLDVFSAIGVFSSGGAARIKPLLGDAEKINRSLKLFWIGCGRGDFAFNGAKEIDDLLTASKINHIFHESEGRHTFTVWREYFSEVAPLLFK